MTTVFSGHQNDWNSVSGDNGAYEVDSAWLAVFGDDDVVALAGADPRVSFFGPMSGFDHETVIGNDGIVAATHADVALTGDNDLIFFDDSPDVLDLTAATVGAWSALYASNVFVNLHGASLSIVGGGVTVDALPGQGDDVASLYQTNGVADLVIGDHASVALNDAQAVARGNDDMIWLNGGSGSTVTVNSARGAADNVFGAGVIDVAAGEVNSIGGGVLIDFLAPGELASISYTEGLWDRIEGAAGQVNVFSAQVSVFGEGQIINFTGGSDNQVSLYQTSGGWDSVYGSFVTAIVNSAQVNFFGAGDGDNIYLQGSGDQLSFYQPSSYPGFTVVGSNATMIFNGVLGAIVGGGNTIYLTAAAYGSDATLTDTNGQWDTVYVAPGSESDGVLFNNAQASIVGSGVQVFNDGGGFNAASFYGAGANPDIYFGAGEIILNNANVTVFDGSDRGGNVFSFGGTTNTLVKTGDFDTFDLAGHIGIDSIAGFNSDDVINLLHTQFADFTGVQAALSQQGDDAVLTFDSADKATFVGVSLSQLTASTFHFV